MDNTMDYPGAPLADRMRPQKIEEILGQKHLLAPGSVLRQSLLSGHIFPVIFWGPPGSGKTTLAKRFGKLLENIDKQKNFRLVYINCRIYKSPYLIISTLARQLNKAIPPRGYSFEELQDLLIRLLDFYSQKILLILDEVDYLIDDYSYITIR